MAEDPEQVPRVSMGSLKDYELPETFPNFEEVPKDHTLSVIQTILKMNSNVTDVFNSPLDQKDEEMRLTIEAMKERQEWEIINNKNFGLIHSIPRHMRVAKFVAG